MDSNFSSPKKKKKMRKRRGGVRAGMQKVLCERLESLKNLNSTTIHEIIEHLLSNYPEYKRQNRHTFINLVQDSLHPLLSRQKRQTQSLLSPPRKKHKINFDVQDTSSEESNSSSDDDNGVLSEDSKKVEQQFDLTKSILRASYIESSSKKEKENNLEFDFAVRDSDEVDFVKLGKEDEGGPGFKELGGKKKVEEEGGPKFKDFGGMKNVLEQLETKVLVSLYQHHLLQWVGVRPISGLLLHGPPGCGKTKLAHAIANETGFPFYKVSATELVSGVSGESEENIRELFQKAYKTAPSIIFIDEIDAIASKRENLQREMERRIVTQLMACMDANSRSFKSSDEQGYVLVIGATNRPNVIDPALRRPGRFDYEIELGVPDENARLEILLVLTRTKRLEGCFDLPKIAMSTPGFVAADLEALVNGAAYLAVKRILDERKSKLFRNSIDEEQSMEWLKEPVPLEIMENIRITMTDFEEAIKMVQPSTTREGFSAIPKVKWEDVGGLDLLRKELDRHIVRRIKYPAKYERFGVDLEMGFLLYGPPGCGKTMIAKAVANEAGANFIHIKGPELLNKYVGESELAVRTLFSRARTCSPCILFFDEVDALTTKHGKEGGWVIERLLNQLLIELDGVDQRRGVFIIGATNRPEVMDNAVLRPGRFGNLLYVPLPTPDQRGLILKALARNKPLDASVDLNAIGRMEACDNFSGADLAALMNEAALAAVDDDVTETIKTTHFEQALTKISPSVTPEQRRHYQVLSERFKSSNISA